MNADLRAASDQASQMSRPRSAAVSDRLQAKSLGKFMAAQGALDEQTVNAIWSAFGAYVARQLRNGKGVGIPKFGNFTFTSTQVDLAGTTNPDARDHQVREPVFIVGKDFVSAVTLRAGIAHNRGAQLRPYDNKGASGIIPKVKINYTEIAVQSSQNKDAVKNGIEQVFRFLSDKVRRGQTATMDIPHVGVFLVRTGIAAVAFNPDILSSTRGVTAKNHVVGNIFGNANARLNMQVKQNEKAEANPLHGHGGALRLTGDAEHWLKSNLNISLKDVMEGRGVNHTQSHGRLQSAKPFYSRGGGLNRYSSMKPQDLKQRMVEQQSQLTEANKAEFDRMSEQRQAYGTQGGPASRRPMSAATRSTVNSFVSRLPQGNRMKLRMIAESIFKNRSSITEILKSTRFGLRNVISSSDIHKVLRKSNLFVEIVTVKQLLKQFNFNYNGPACSFLDLFAKCKQFLNTEESFEVNSQYNGMGPISVYSGQVPQNLSKPIQTSNSVLRVIQQIKDVFYSSRKRIEQIYQEAKVGQFLDEDSFVDYFKQINSQISSEDIRAVFQHVAKGRNRLSYETFQQSFKWDVPTGQGFETEAVRKIREWMFKNGLSSETSFEYFLKHAGRIREQRLSHLEFHRAIIEAGLDFSAAEVDALFAVLDQDNEGELTLQKWKSRVYEDTQNPLQMLREVIRENGLTADDLLDKMRLRVWDEDMDYMPFQNAMRKLDPTLSEPQIRYLSKTLKGNNGKIAVTSLLRNLVGHETETVDFRNKMLRQIYQQVYPSKEQAFIDALEKMDPLNDGRVEPIGLKQALNKIVRGISEDNIDRFIRFLEKDKSGKIDYMDFINKMTEVSNRDHNPFKSVIQRIAYFLQTNNLSGEQLLKKISSSAEYGGSSQGVPVADFAAFMKRKIDKKRPENHLRQIANQIDVDKDGVINSDDIQACLKNIKTESFFKNGGEALKASTFSSGQRFFPSERKLDLEKAQEICKQIRTALQNQRVANREAFNRMDQNKDGFISYAEFTEGIDKFLPLSGPVKEKLFALMDKNSIGLVDYQNFIDILQLSSASTAKQGNVEDNFNWEQDVLSQLRQWIARERISPEEAFKCLDVDFDGLISKEDLKHSLMTILKIKPEKIIPTKLDRLLRLMDFYKVGGVQLQDIQRLVNDENPYTTETAGKSAQNFNKTFGGGIKNASTFDWKLSAIQQIGLIISKKYSSLSDAFEVASESLQKIKFDQFKKFVEDLDALAGFNLTVPLLQKLFSEIDPHKKGYLTENDWKNAFTSFNWKNQILIELRNTVQCSFCDLDSAFAFFCSFGKTKKQCFGFGEFQQAINSLTANRFKRSEIMSMWKQMTENESHASIDFYLFRLTFEGLRFTGSSAVQNLNSAQGNRMTVVSQSSSSSTWNVDVFEKLRSIIRTSPFSFEEIFKKMDSDGNGTISQLEFRNAIKELKLGLKSKEIDQLMTKIDSNSDGKIDWKEFIAKFKQKDIDERLKSRSKDKMARLKELMILHMTSTGDAFRNFDESKSGKLAYGEFSKMVSRLHQLAGEAPATYAIVKDLFDTIDIRKDGIIDQNEWEQTFGNITEGSKSLTIKATPLNTWENSRECKAIGSLIARNRKVLTEELAKRNDPLVTFEEAKKLLDSLLHTHYPKLEDEKLQCILAPSRAAGAVDSKFDFSLFLEVLRKRHT